MPTPDLRPGPAVAAEPHRERAERLWAVSVDRLPPGRGGVRKALTRPVRRAFARLARPLVEEQREFNDVVLKLVDELHERVGTALNQSRALELEERVLRLERSARAGGAAPSAPAPAQPAAPFDYFAFESRMRGPTRVVRARQEAYVEELSAGPVLDVGCGRGEFLVLLREAGVDARGVDADPDMVAFCRGEGLDVEHGDALAYLEELEARSLGGIFAAQVLEHLPPPALVRFLALAAERLRPGGTLVAETINPLSLGALKNFFADLTHAQPLVPETLALLAREAGFRHVELRFVNPPDESERLREVPLPADPAFDDARRALAVDVERLNELLYGPQDYALVART